MLFHRQMLRVLMHTPMKKKTLHIHNMQGLLLLRKACESGQGFQFGGQHAF